MHQCKTCGKETDVRRTRCGPCNTTIRRIRNKMAAVQLLGGNCTACALPATIDNLPVFQFHHRDPNQKDFALGMVGNKSWQSIKDEILKCDLLCANCHQLQHASSNRRQIAQEASSYAGENQELNLLVREFMGL